MVVIYEMACFLKFLKTTQARRIFLFLNVATLYVCSPPTIFQIKILLVLTFYERIQTLSFPLI